VLSTKEEKKYRNTLLHSSNITYTHETLYCRMQSSIHNEVKNPRNGTALFNASLGFKAKSLIRAAIY
jgi:hypothetical protein